MLLLPCQLTHYKYIRAQHVKNKLLATFNEHLNPRAVCKEGLGALGVIEWTVANATPRSPNGEVAAVVHVAGAVAVLGRFVDNLWGKNKQEISDQLNHILWLNRGLSQQLSFWNTCAAVAAREASWEVKPFAMVNKDHTGV